MAESQVLVRHEDLESFVSAIFEKTGVPASDAAFFAKSLVNINLWGIDSHGVLRVPIYAKRLQAGSCNPNPEIKTLKSAITLEVLHGDDGPGQTVGRVAMERAIELAKEYNVGIVGAVRSNHFGAAATFTRMAAKKGMLGVAMTNVVQNVVAPGGSKPIIGNNPFSIAVPTYGDYPFVLDISLSAVAGGKLLLASKKGEKIPFGWGTDQAGRPTDDPNEAFKGFLLPVGGHKGLGMAYAVEIMTGLLSGGVFLDAMKGMYKYPDDPSLTSHLMMAINISAIMEPDEQKARMTDFSEKIHASPMWDESKEMLLPGEIEHRTMLKRQEMGIPLPQNLYEEIVALAESLGVEKTLLKI
ncbi:MAG: Ldh family oxidoreductase [Anaerolineae bacterium]|jgi:L-2-hydroxycarboxylate dehydrogenase (NAD+)|nr:Ldh family oxidoreductase [Anaerolineae bacterium]MBT7989276.1 Ldh family oxidoreductase [Anaerolineae bacterium]